MIDLSWIFRNGFTRFARLSLGLLLFFANSSFAATDVSVKEGNVMLIAGEKYRQVGSDVIAAGQSPSGSGGDIAITAKTVDIVEARQTSRTVTETKSKQSGLTIALSSPIITAVQTAQQMIQAAGDTQDGRMKLLAAATIGLAANNAIDAIKAGQGKTVELPDGTVKDKQIGVPDAYEDGGWCIHEEGDVWLVYHSERGRRSRPAIFTSDFDAANFYLWIHVCSPTADNSRAATSWPARTRP